MNGHSEMQMKTISGRVSNISVDHITLNILDQPSDRARMAATGVLAAAMGLSGVAAAMATMSSDEMNEVVAKVTFELDGSKASALLAAWPFKDGDNIKLVGTHGGDGEFIALAALDESRRIVSLYPHVNSGSHAHWSSVMRYSLWVGVFIATLTISAMCLGTYALGYGFAGKFLPLSGLYLLCVSAILFVGYRIGRRFKKFVHMAESIFAALGWPDVKRVSLRRSSAALRQPGDSAELGDVYFRY